MKQRKAKITDLMALVVFAVFAMCILAVLLTGADVYKGLVSRGESSYAARTAAQYVTTRVRQTDRTEEISIEDFDGQDALVLREKIDETVYVTRVYCYDGYIRELFTPENGDFSPGDGEKVLEAEELSFELSEGMLTVKLLLRDGTERDLTLYLRSGEGARP